MLEGSKVSQIVTQADLNKAPVGLYFFGVITLLEMHLTRLVNHYFPTDSWCDRLSRSRLKKAKQFHSARKGQNQEMDLVECLQFCDKRQLLLASSAFVNASPLESKTTLKRILEKGEKLRNQLAHANGALLGSSWRDTIRLVNSLELLTERLEQIDG